VREWALECGLPGRDLEEMRARSQALLARQAAEADALTARALGAGDEDGPEAPAEAQAPAAANPTGAEPGVEGEAELMGWVHAQRQRETGWAEIAQEAARRGHTLSPQALRSRYARWQRRG